MDQTTHGSNPNIVSGAEYRASGAGSRKIRTFPSAETSVSAAWIATGTSSARQCATAAAIPDIASPRAETLSLRTLPSAAALISRISRISRISSVGASGSSCCVGDLSAVISRAFGFAFAALEDQQEQEHELLLEGKDKDKDKGKGKDKDKGVKSPCMLSDATLSSSFARDFF